MLCEHIITKNIIELFHHNEERTIEIIIQKEILKTIFDEKHVPILCKKNKFYGKIVIIPM